MKWIYHSLKNLIFYRAPRRPDARLVSILDRLKTDEQITDVKQRITDLMLWGVGLKTVNSTDKSVPPSVYLTPVQTDLKKMVEDHGFIVGLL